MTEYLNYVLKSIEIIKSMFNYRGLDISQLDKISNNEIEIMLKNSIFDIKINDDYKILYILSKNNLKNFTNYISENFCKNVLIIIDNNMKDKKILKDIHMYNQEQEKDDNKVSYQIFKLNELQYDVASHILCPKHILINDHDEIIKIIKELNIESKTKLPKILLSDPMAKYINAKAGNLIKIITNNKSSGEYVMYKYC
jgi:DNA-directed RNA polymerase subunit H (RpoH/RPB5)